ncbi:MAG: hypothetical protein ABEJ89_09275 [Haloarculaceae archaeon]
MRRRNLIKTIGGIATTTAVGGSALLAASGGASATAGGSIADPPAVETDDGTIKWVAVQTTGRLTWDGFDTPAKKARIMVYVTLKRNGSTIWGENLIHDTGMFDLTSSWGGSGEDSGLSGDSADGQSGYIASDADWGILQKNQQHLYNNGYGLPQNPGPVGPLEADQDGSTVQTRVVLRSVYLLFDENGNELTGTQGYPSRPEASSSFVVTVNNQSSSTGFGDSDGEGDTSDSASVGV